MTYRSVSPVYINASPAGSIYATAEDMARFMGVHLQRGRYGGKTLLSEASALEMQRRQFTHDRRIPGVCYAFFERFENGHRLILHGGAIHGYGSFLFLVPDHNLGVFFSCNAFSAQVGELFWKLLSAFFDRYLPDLRPASETVEANPGTLAHVVGHYQTTRYSQHSLIKIAALMGQVQVEASEEGALVVDTPVIIQDQPWRSVGPLLFRQDKTDELAAFGRGKDGGITHLYLQNFAFERIAWYETRTVQLGLLGFAVAMFLSAGLAWPLGYLIRRRRTGAGAPGRPARWARALAGAASALNMVFVVGLIVNQEKFNLEIGYGVPPVIFALLWAPLAATALAVPCLLLTIVLWKERVWSAVARVHYSLVALAILEFALFLHYWNLLGFKW